MSDSNIIKVESPERKITTPKIRISNKELLTSSKSRSKLPKNFHQLVIELENNFTKDQSFEIMTELLNLYKVNNSLNEIFRQALNTTQGRILRHRRIY